MMSHSSHHDILCQACGATIYREQIDNGIARYEEGRMMCVRCVSDFEEKHDKQRRTSGGYSHRPIAFAEENPEPGKSAPADSAAGMTGSGHFSLAGVKPHEFARPIEPKASTATRCRTFHCKLNDAAIEFMNNAINEWIDAHDDIRIKFATSTVGNFVGKISDDPNLIVTLYY